LVNRVKAILMQPKSEWQVIDSEPATVGSIYMGYVVPLAAIPAVCLALGLMFLGARNAYLGATFGTGWAIKLAIGVYVGYLIDVFVFALIIDALAPTFGGQKNQIQALKVAAYSFTAAWVAGIFSLIPFLGILGILGLYSLYLLYLGLPVLMKAPPDRAMGYTVVSIVAAIVVMVVVRVIINKLTGGYGYY
jgi:hypothetical protein